MFKAEGSQSRGRGFESLHRILDENAAVQFERKNGETKVSQIGQTAKKYFEKNSYWKTEWICNEGSELKIM